MFLSEEGIVVRLDSGNTVWVETNRSGACEGCSSKGACHMGNPGKMEAHAQNDAGAVVGDKVLLEIPHRSLIRVSLLLYIFPVLALAAGAFTGDWLAGHYALDSQAVPALLGFAFFLCSIIIVVISGRIAGKDRRYMPKVTRILEGNG